MGASPSPSAAKPLVLAGVCWAVLPWQAGSGWFSAPLAGPWSLGVGLAIALGFLFPLVLPRSQGLAQLASRGSPVAASLLALGLLTGAVAHASLGPGMAATGGVLVYALGHALAGVGRLRDPFLAGFTLLLASLVLLFILYPVWALVRNVSWERLIHLLADNRFLMLENPYSARSETAWTAALVVLGGAVGARLHTASRGKGLVVGAVLGAVLGVGLFARGALATSLLVAGVVAPVSTLLALAFALLEQRSRLRWIRSLLAALAVLPLISPPFVLAFALILAFGRNGFVTAGLLGLDANFLFGPVGVALAQVLAFAPVAYLALRGSVQNLDAALEEAATTLGADGRRVLATVTWPLLRPGLANALMLTVIESLSDFGNPLILGGDRGYLATEVFIAFTGRYDHVEAALYGLVLLSLVLAVFWLQYRWLGRSSFVTTTGRPSGARPRALPWGMELGLTAVLGLWGVLVVGLYGSVVVGSLVRLWGFDYGFTLKHYRDFLVLGLPVFLHTLKIALYAAVPTAFLGVFLAYLIYRQNFPGKRVLEFCALLSFALPGTVMGVGYVMAFNPAPWMLTGTTLLVVLALVFRELPVGMRAGIAGLSQIDPSLEEASSTLGASPPRTLARVVLPLLLPALVGGLAFAFVRSMTAVSQVIFLVGPGNLLATVLLLGWVEQGQMGRAAAMSTIMILSLLLVVLALFRLNRSFDVRQGGLA